MRTYLSIAAAALAGLLAQSTADAQAWVDYKGALNAGFAYAYGMADEIVETPDHSLEGRDIRVHRVALDVEYVPIENLAVSASVPLVALKYTGDMGFPHGDYDDGDTHYTLTDFRLNTRYAPIVAPVAAALELGVSIPMTDYERQGLVNAGRRLKQLHLGASVGKTFDPWVPNLYVHARYEFSLVEKLDETPVTAEVGQNRSDIGFQVGYFFFDKLEVNLGADFRIAHGGVEFEDFAMLHPDEQLWHDPLLKEQFTLVGGGLGYRITDAIGVNATYRQYVTGRNTLNNKILALSLSWAVLAP